MSGRRLRIAMIEPAGKGGLCHYAHALCDALAEAGHDVLLTTSLRDEGRLFGRRRYAVAQPFDELRPRPVRLFAWMRALRRFAPDVIHLQGAAHPEIDLLLARFLRLRLRVPIVYTAHEVIPRTEPRFARAVVRGLSRACDAVIVHGPKAESDWLRLAAAGTPAPRIVPFGHYGCLAEVVRSVRPEAPALPAPPPDTKLLLAFGVLDDAKGLPELLEAMRTLGPEGRAHLLLAGQIGKSATGFRALLDDPAIRPHVTLHEGYVPLPELPRVVEAADIVVLPYRRNYQSAAAFTAAAFAKPIVATRLPAFDGVVEDGRTGTLVPPEDPAALTAALRALVARPREELRSMGAAGRHLAETRFSWKRIADKTVRIYEELMDTTPRERALSTPRPFFGQERAIAGRGSALARRLFGVFGELHMPGRLRFRHVLRGLAPVVAARPAARLLDAGCGDGAPSFYLARRLPDLEIHAVDFSEENVANCRRIQETLGLRNVRFEAADLSRPLPVGGFDAAMMSDVLEHIDDDRAALANIRAALKPGGVFVLHVPGWHPKGHLWEKPWFPAGVRNRLAHWNDTRTGSYLPESYKDAREGYTVEEIDARMREAGFRVLRLEPTFGTFGLLGHNLFYISRAVPLLMPLFVPLAFACAEIEMHQGRIAVGQSTLVVAERPREEGDPAEPPKEEANA